MRRESNSKDYVSDGLILHLDAIKNAINGSHSNSTTTWYDLSPSGNNMSLVSPTWAEDYIAADGVNTIGQTSGNLNLSTNNKFTIEIFIRQINNTSGAMFFEQTTNYNNNIGAIIGTVKDGSPSSDVRVGIRKSGGSGYLYGGINSFSDDIYHCVYDDTTDNYLTELEMFKNSVQQTVVFNSGATSIANTTLRSDILYLFCRAGIPQARFNGSIRAIRIYNRKLSTAELYQNKITDFRRYGIIK